MSSARLKRDGRMFIDSCSLFAVESVGVLSLAISFLAMILAVEFAFHMKLVLKQQSLVPAFATQMMFRELGPVVTCLLLGSRIGASLAAEIATMKGTDQLDALRSFGVDPVRYLVLPRSLGCVFSTVTLTWIAMAVACFVSYAVASHAIGVTPGEFKNAMFAFSKWHDFVGASLKSLVFGLLIAGLSSHAGLVAKSGSRGVGEAATAAVVRSSVAIILSDFFLTYFLYA